MQNRLAKYGVGIFVLIASAVLLGILYLGTTCQAVQIARFHNGETQVSLISQKGNGFEPDNCGSLIIQAME